MRCAALILHEGLWRREKNWTRAGADKMRVSREWGAPVAEEVATVTVRRTSASSVAGGGIITSDVAIVRVSA